MELLAACIDKGVWLYNAMRDIAERLHIKAKSEPCSSLSAVRLVFI